MTLTPDEELDRFARIASHDLSAPLRGIRSLVSFLAEDLQPVLTDESREMMELVQTRVGRMEALVDGLRAYSRARHRLSDPEPVAVEELLGEIVAPYGPRVRSRVTIAADPSPLEADRVSLETVLDCLVSNAVKFGRGTPIRIRAEADDVGWRFEVTDGGPGIPPDLVDAAFEPFRTLQPRDEIDGAGLGLTIAKRSVEARGGTIGLRSADGDGMTAWFTWPGSPAETPGREERETT